jgi:hypothetical protein
MFLRSRQLVRNCVMLEETASCCEKSSHVGRNRVVLEEIASTCAIEGTTCKKLRQHV